MLACVRQYIIRKQEEDILVTLWPLLRRESNRRRAPNLLFGVGVVAVSASGLMTLVHFEVTVVAAILVVIEEIPRFPPLFLFPGH